MSYKVKNKFAARTITATLFIVGSIVGASQGIAMENRGLIEDKSQKINENPVLDAMFGYERPSDNKRFHFKVKDLVKDGTFDLSNKIIFESASKYLVLTTDLEEFFQIDEKSCKVAILITPRSMIEEKLETSAKLFKPVMADWQENNSPIGIFWRMERWDNLNCYNYCTNEEIFINKHRLNLSSLLSWKGKKDYTRAQQHGSLHPAPINSHYKQKQIISRFIFRPLKQMTVKEIETYKIWLFEQGLKKAYEEGKLQIFPKELHKIIGNRLHELRKYQVLEGQLEYKQSDSQSFRFNMKDIVKESTVYLSKEKIFGDNANNLIITTDPEKFFHIDTNSFKLVMLISTRVLIEEKLKYTIKPFGRIMNDWSEDNAPIGMFWRSESWTDLHEYFYLTNKNINFISQNNLTELWKCSTGTYKYAAKRDPVQFQLRTSYDWLSGLIFHF